MLKGDKLGEGTFGIVYSARSPISQSNYAVKRNLSEYETSFIGVPREVDVLNKLRYHPHVVKLEKVAFGHPFQQGCFSPLVGNSRESQKDDSIHFIFKQAIYDLHQFIYGVPVTDFGVAKRYMISMLLGTEYMHGHRIIHRDLKPSNILIFPDEVDACGNANIAKISDLGLAKPYTYQGSQTPETVTSWYRAPEIALAYPNYDYKVDIWSLGCIFYEMVSKKAFLKDVPDNNDEIISTILNVLPEELPKRKLVDLVKSNKWRDVKLGPKYNRTRKSFLTQLSLTDSGKAKFEEQAGSIEKFCDLLTNMLKFDWEERFTAKQCLDHPFFSDNYNMINETRKLHPPISKKDKTIYFKSCIERKWMTSAAIEIFNNRFDCKWYTHRILFQAIDLFDRYITVMYHNGGFPPNAVESENKGLIHDKFDTELRFMVCLYLCIKYFSSVHYPISYDIIVSEEYRTPEAQLIAEQFEASFVATCLEYDIYQPTLYETADDFDDRLDDNDIRNLIILYTMNNSVCGMKLSEIYKYYRDNLRYSSMEKLLNPIPKPVLKEAPQSVKPAINFITKSTNTIPIKTKNKISPFPYSKSMPKIINKHELLIPLNNYL